MPFDEFELREKLLAKDDEAVLAMLSDVTRREQREEILIRAAECGRLQIVSKLIADGIDVNASKLFHTGGLYEDHKQSYTALTLAAKYGHVEVMRMLINAGANVDASSHYYFHFFDDDEYDERDEWGSCQRDCSDTSQYYFDPDLNDEVHCPPRPPTPEHVKEARKIQQQLDRAGETALHLAVESGMVGAVRELLFNGAKVDSINRYGYTPLLLASRDGFVGGVRELAWVGANLDARQLSPDPYERTETVLTAAVSNRHVAVVSELILMGAGIGKRELVSFMQGNEEELNQLMAPLTTKILLPLIDLSRTDPTIEADWRKCAKQLLVLRRSSSLWRRRCFAIFAAIKVVSEQHPENANLSLVKSLLQSTFELRELSAASLSAKDIVTCCQTEPMIARGLWGAFSVQLVIAASLQGAEQRRVVREVAEHSVEIVSRDGGGAAASSAAPVTLSYGSYEGGGGGGR